MQLLALLRLFQSTCLRQVSIYRGIQAATLSVQFLFLMLVLLRGSHHSCDHYRAVHAPQYVILVVCIPCFIFFLQPRFHPSQLRLLQCNLRLQHVRHLCNGLVYLC